MTNKIRDLLSENIRLDEGDDEELRQSMQSFGWRKEFPALLDEHKVVLVGHRRMRIAEELGIDPVVDVLQLGEGDEADAERMKIALVSNLGGKLMTVKDRQRIAEHLYGRRGWTMQRIAAALNIAQSTVTEDLGTLSTVDKVDRVDRLGRKNTGRPKGSKKPSKYSPALEQKIASDVLDLGKTRNQAAAEAGVSDIVVRRVVARELGRRDVEPEVTIDDLSVTQRSKAEVFQRRLQRENEVRYQQDVTAGVMDRLEIILVDYKARLADADKVLNRHKGIFTSSQYRTLLACLHPDGRKSVSDEALTKVRMMIEEYAPVLRQQKEPLQPVPMPKTVADWMNLKRKSPKTSGKKGAVARR